MPKIRIFPRGFSLSRRGQYPEGEGEKARNEIEPLSATKKAKKVIN